MLRTNDTIFAKIMGIELVIKPNPNQQAIPNTKMIYITSEISFVFLVLIIFNAWGINAKVVQAAAIYPIISEICIVIYHLSTTINYLNSKDMENIINILQLLNEAIQ